MRNLNEKNWSGWDKPFIFNLNNFFSYCVSSLVKNARLQSDEALKTYHSKNNRDKDDAMMSGLWWCDDFIVGTVLSERINYLKLSTLE